MIVSFSKHVDTTVQQWTEDFVSPETFYLYASFKVAAAVSVRSDVFLSFEIKIKILRKNCPEALRSHR